MAKPSKPRFPKRPARSKPRQTTLQLSPLAPSSPAKGDYSSAVQSRLASVRYKGARLNANASLETQSSEEILLPTPEPSSQIQDLNTSESKVSDAQGEVANIYFEEDLKDEDEDDEDDLISPVQKRRKISDGTPVPVKSCPLPRRSTRLNSGSSPLPTIEGIGTFATPVNSSPLGRQSTHLRRGKQSVSPSRLTRSPSTQTLVSVEIATPPQRRSSKLSDLGSAETSDEDDKILASQPAARRRHSRAAKDTRIVNDDELEYVSDDEPRKRRGPSRRKSTCDDFVVDDEEIEYITSDEDDALQAGPTKSDHSSSSSAKKARNTAPRRRTRDEQDELDDDLQNLHDSDEDLSATKTRTRGGPVTTKRDQAKEHLELLRRRRAGEKVPRIEDSDDDLDDLPETHLDLIGHPDYDEQGSVHSSIDTDPDQELAQVEEDEDDFVIEDSIGRLGRPNSDMPLQFTSFASAKPRELFVHIIEWLVKNKIAPAFSREDELYTLAFSRVDDQVKAQAGSRLISAAWGNEFKRAILARPAMKVSMLPGSDEDNVRTCDACNRLNHPARYEFVFSGQPYFKKTLEPVDSSSDEGYEDELDRDEEGHTLPSETRRFYLGRFCAANADMGHKLTHWKYHLNDNLLSYLEEQGVLSPDAIVAREKLNKKKREKQAEDIVDSMQEIGMIADLWAEFENNLNDARLGMEGFDRRGGRSKGRVGAVRSTANGRTMEWDRDRVRVTRALESDSED
ncbi:uncharacterized protein A1O9_08268 [Exophiala aquamarina CBS 119918]|uniref:DUF4211 domain-containing protein n=1 Tax=Exophiala aquamarina CBS 119918 TaxID=1182545 RepID=A0A072P891_9EURO|nr:uncharacterized protein A1O9_08268 [Exophiala aquamarina CBS 119918]KEF55518.1 hypothetical protein A1O9_08268 [Exophiala aquamarina CBS 119918]